MRNMQGTFDDGRGASGLNAVGTIERRTTRYGKGTPRGTRPPRLTGKPKSPRDPLREKRFTIMPVMPGGPVIHLPVGPPRRITKRLKVRHRRQFINWLQRWAPQLYLDAKKYADVAQAREGTLNGLGGWWESFSDGVIDLGGKVLQYKTQKEILDAQMERMRQGLPPLQTAEYAPTVAVKVDPGTTAEITGAIGAGFGKMLPWVAIGGGILLFLTMGKKRR